MKLIKRLVSTLVKLEKTGTRIKRRNARRRTFSVLKSIRTWIDNEWPSIDKPERVKDPNRLELLERCLSTLADKIWKSRKGPADPIIVRFRSMRATRGRACRGSRWIHLAKDLAHDLTLLGNVFVHEYAHLEDERGRGERWHGDEFHLIMAAVESDWGEEIRRDLRDSAMWPEDKNASET